VQARHYLVQKTHAVSLVTTKENHPTPLVKTDGGGVGGCKVWSDLSYSMGVQAVLSFFPVVGIGTLPQPLTRRRVCPLPPLVLGGGAHSMAREVVGESQFRRGDIHCGTLYIYVLCGLE
jgi:hypothetical protein